MDVVVTQVTHTKLVQADKAVQAADVVDQANHGQTDVDTVIAVADNLAAVAAVAARHMAAAGADLALLELFGATRDAGLAAIHITYNI